MDQGLIGMQYEAVPAHPFAQDMQDSFRILLVLEANHEESRPGESHPRALAEPYVNLSAHTAPIIQP
jgi:hypothetical protein